MVEYLGIAHAVAGNGAAARAAFEERLQIISTLAAADPADAALQRDLALSHRYMGDVEWDAQQYEAAAAAYIQSYRVLSPLVDANSADSVLVHDGFQLLLRMMRWVDPLVRADVFYAYVEDMRQRGMWEEQDQRELEEVQRMRSGGVTEPERKRT
jgi:hypothetical protein